MFRKMLNKVRQITSKQLVVAGVFTVALAGAIGGGMALRQTAFANSNNQTIRDCGGSSLNSVDNKNLNGGCGALTPSEFIADVKANNPSDLKATYADAKVGALTADKYDRFAKEARYGVLKRNGDLVVDGQVVMTDAWTVGRTTLGNTQREPITLGGKTFYHSHPSVSFASSRAELDVMVLFDKDGTVEFTVMESCGNPLTKGKKVKSGGTCESLQKKAVTGKENTFTFTTNVSKFGLAKIAKVEYYVDGQLWRTETDPAKATPERTFTKSADVTVKVYVDLPGGNQKVVESAACKTRVEVKIKEVFYVCKNLIATARDNTNRNFRFTVVNDQSPEVTLKDVDFTLDGKTTTTGVTTKDGQGRIYKDYDFTDAVEHTISAKVNFTYEGKTVTAKEACIAKVTPEKPPVCVHNPNLPPEHPDCKAPECPEKPGSGFPPGDARCKEQPELPKTGPASILGLFAGASIAGGAAHKIVLRRRNRDL